MRETTHKPPPPPPAPAQRKIVQIAAAFEGSANYADLFAVCDDGTAWQLLNHENHWQQLPAIPQPE